jgi:hypothetical protein
VPSFQTTTSRRPSRRALWWAPTSSPIPQESKEGQAKVDDERHGVLLDIVEALAEPRRGLEVELAPERQRHPRVLALDVHRQARGVELGLVMDGGLGGDLRQPLEPRRQVPKFRSPSSFMLPGRSTADASPTPISPKSSELSVTKIENTPIITAAALVTIPAVARIPCDTAPSVISPRSKPSR